MNDLKPAHPFPQMTVPRVGGGTLPLGTPQEGRNWQMVVVYRGLHCPICKKYLYEMEEMQTEFLAEGVEIVAVSGDGQAKAQQMVDEKNLNFPIGYGLSLAQMKTLGLYVSDPRSPQETDRPFPEPGLYVINDAGDLQIVDISNAPFARPALRGVLNGIKYIRANDYPIRGTHAAA